MIEFRFTRVTAARHVHGHVVWLRFDDGLEGELDLSFGLRGKLFEPLQDPAFFALVDVEHGALTWPNGADWAPETLYERLRERNGVEVHSGDDGLQAESAYPSDMPEISRFFGVVIRMLANDHAPPHFHAQYGEYEITVSIHEGIVAGRFPARALRFVLEWRDLHTDALLENWERLRAGELPRPIEPLS